ncbi:MAG: hypothetical protein Kow0080_32430 [Candidatus Promineifilaceae bacterium]
MIPEPQPENRRGWFLPVILLLFLLYWVFAWALERIDLTAVISTWWQGQLPFLPLPSFFITFAEMLHPRVLRHLIPPIVGWLLAYNAAVRLVQTLYDLPDRQTAQQFLRRLSAKGVPAEAVARVSWQTLAEDRESVDILRVGGPGLVSVGNGDVAVTELNGRFYRVLGAGTHVLTRFEYVYAVLDLRPQERNITDISLLTRDGLPITADVHLIFRIRTGGEPPTRSNPFPYDEEAVRQAAYAEAIQPDGKLSTWVDEPERHVRRLLPRIVAKYALDNLLHPSSSVDPNLAVRDELFGLLRRELSQIGIELTGLHVGRLEVPEPIAEQYIANWQAHLNSQIRLRQAESDAFAMEEKEIARIEAEATIMNAIVEGVRRARLEGHHGDLREVVALRLVEALEKMARQSEGTYPLPAHLIAQLDGLRLELAKYSAVTKELKDDSAE